MMEAMVGVVGTMQALEAVKLLAGLGSRLVGRMQMIDGRGLQITEMRVARHLACPVCAAR